MVLAEYNQNTPKWQITHIFIITMFEFDGILLKPCLLQPCFHVAGLRVKFIVNVPVLLSYEFI